MTTNFHNHLASWFGDIPFKIIEEYSYAVDGAPHLFATVQTHNEVLAMRVRRCSGRVKVSADSRVSL